MVSWLTLSRIRLRPVSQYGWVLGQSDRGAYCIRKGLGYVSVRVELVIGSGVRIKIRIVEVYVIHSFVVVRDKSRILCLVRPSWPSPGIF